MRKRSKYRPKPVMSDPLNHVLTSVTMVAAHESYLVDLRIKNHDCLTALTQGRASRKEMDTVISMGNVCEALYRFGFGTDYKDILAKGIDAIYQVGSRGVSTNKFIMRAQEINAINDLMELHAAQLDVITIRDMEKALALVHKEYAQEKMRRIVNTQEASKDGIVK